MKRKKLEALAEAIACYSGYREPGSPLYEARNPGGLKAYSPKHPHDAEGNRVFSSVIDGMQALLFDVQLKLDGKSKAHLQPANTLADLALAYNLPATTAEAWAKFLRKALHSEDINKKLLLNFFTEDSDNG